MANRTRFAGQYRAVDFNYGGAGPDAPPALVVSAASNAANTSGTISVYGGNITLTDGTIVSVFSTNASVSIINASGSDTQTPTAVATNVYSNTGGLTASVTATWTYAHNPGDRISSGTIGLQEAINYANLKGGGTVIVDNDWVVAGGTAAMLAAVTLPAGVTILDNRVGGQPLKTYVVLSNAQILTLSSTAVQILPAPGAGYFYNILKATLVNENTGTAYTSGGAITIGYGATVVTQALSGTIAATFLTSPTTTQVIQLAGANLTSTTEALYDNQPIAMNCATGNFATGTGTLKVSLTYTLESK
jgi:hypothetical protein